MTPRVLILAYGNPLRSDDGVAWHVAELLRKQLSPNIGEIVCTHQLTPELAETASYSSGVIFVDARENGEPGRIYLTRVATPAGEISSTHMFIPAQVMALCEMLYGRNPRAYEVSVTGECFSHGEQLSGPLSHALPLITAIIVRLAYRIDQEPCRRPAFDVEVLSA